MSVLGRFPRWLRRLLLGVNLAAALEVLAWFWTETFPNLIASWVVGAAVAAVALPAGAWLGRWLDTHHSGHHADTRAHITAEVTAGLAPIQQSLNDLHAKIDQQQGGGAP